MRNTIRWFEKKLVLANNLLFVIIIEKSINLVLLKNKTNTRARKMYQNVELVNLVSCFYLGPFFCIGFVVE